MPDNAGNNSSSWTPDELLQFHPVLGINIDSAEFQQAQSVESRLAKLTPKQVKILVALHSFLSADENRLEPFSQNELVAAMKLLGLNTTQPEISRDILGRFPEYFNASGNYKPTYNPVDLHASIMAKYYTIVGSENIGEDSGTDPYRQPLSKAEIAIFNQLGKLDTIDSKLDTIDNLIRQTQQTQQTQQTSTQAKRFFMSDDVIDLIIRRVKPEYIEETYKKIDKADTLHLLGIIAYCVSRLEKFDSADIYKEIAFVKSREISDTD